MRYRLKLFFLLCIALLSFPFYSVYALDCPNPGQTGAVTISDSCTFLGTVTGALSGDITIATTKTLTIGTGQTVVFSSGNKIDKTATTTYIVIIGTGKIVKGGKICLPDTDGDNYPSSTDPTVQTYNATSCPAGTIARDAGTIVYQADCNDGNAAVMANLTCYADGDSDGHYSTSSNSVCAGATCASVGQSATVGDDCCDTDLNAYLGSTYYGTVGATGCSGGGGYDYDCDGDSNDKSYPDSFSGSTCVDIGGSCGFGVVGTSGWTTGVPACGGTGTYQQAGCCPYSAGDCPSAGQYPSCSIGGQFTSGPTQGCK